MDGKVDLVCLPGPTILVFVPFLPYRLLAHELFHVQSRTTWRSYSKAGSRHFRLYIYRLAISQRSCLKSKSFHSMTNDRNQMHNGQVKPRPSESRTACVSKGSIATDDGQVKPTRLDPMTSTINKSTCYHALLQYVLLQYRIPESRFGSYPRQAPTPTLTLSNLGSI